MTKPREHTGPRSTPATDDLCYLAGFHNEHASEAEPGALPVGQFSPQRPPLGLYAEKFSLTAFTVPRRDNRRNWLYRIRPSVVRGPFVEYPEGSWLTAPLAGHLPPEPLRWDPWPVPDAPCDFVDGITTLGANGNAALQLGIGIHLYLANRSMEERFFYGTDGELLLVPQQGRLQLFTECGRLAVRPGELAVVPRGLKLRVALPDGPSRGYVMENYGAPLRLPERGLVGSDGFANDRDFLFPTAWYEDRAGDFELVARIGGRTYRAAIDRSPLDVVGWVGTAAPYKYDLARYNTINTVSYDHPDPSIFTVLTSPSDTPGVANADFVIFPERWMVAEHTFRPPWFHRNVMSEFMGLIHGIYDARAAGFAPGGASLHNAMVPHGPETSVVERATQAELVPVRYEATLAFMFETRYPVVPSAAALAHPALQQNYRACWQDLPRRFPL